MKMGRKRGTEESIPLTFQWVVRETAIWRLLLFGLATLLALGGFFFVFRVVYPESNREPLVSRRVLMLNGDDPATKALVQRAVDQSFALLPSPAPAALGEGLLPEFQPSFSGYRIRLKGLSSSVPEAPISRTAAPGKVVLAPLESPSRSAPPPRPVTKSRLWVEVEGGAAGRLVETPVLDDVPLVEPVRLQFRLGVDERGRVVFALPLEPIEDAALQARLQEAVEHLRFRSREVAGVDWANARFVWKEEAAQ